MHLLFNGGFGDFLNLDSVLSDEQRDQIEAIVWDSNRRPVFEEAIRANPYWSHCDHLSAPSPTDLTLFTYQAVFYRLPFYGSTFLRMDLPDIDHLGLPKEYACIQPSTTINDKGTRGVRDMRPQEWRGILAWLDRLGIPGVVLNGPRSDQVPRTKRLVDLSGRTSVLESIAVLKASQAFAGVDSWQAILAVQALPADRLRIRTRNQYLLQESDNFYPPHQEIEFLYRSLDGEPYAKRKPRVVDSDMKTIQLNVDLIIGKRIHPKGSVVELPDERADQLLKLNHAQQAVFERASKQPTIKAAKNATKKVVEKEVKAQ